MATGRKKIEVKTKFELCKEQVDGILERAKESYKSIGKVVDYSRIDIVQVDKEDNTWYKVIYRNAKNRDVFHTWVGILGDLETPTQNIYY